MKTGSDFSGVGAFEQALKRLKIDYETIFACDIDKYARQTYIENYGQPKYFPEDVYDRKIPTASLDIYMTSPPCQAFSLAGSRKGENDDRGVLFYNSHEFIKVNKPRYFIFENVKGLLSDDKGRTFQRWIDYLAQSVNGQPVIFPHEESVMYHIYYRVLNSKKFGVPQNRERIFIIGIRDDKDNDFSFPKEQYLTKKLKDILENEVDHKYYLSEKAINGIKNSTYERKQHIIQNKDYADTILSRDYKDPKCIKTENCQEIEWIADYRNDEGLRIRKDNISPCRASLKMPPIIKQYSQKAQDISPTLTEPHHNPLRLYEQSKIRRLTPRECFRLQDFPDSFTWSCSDTQAYKQAGNSITVGVLEKILRRLLNL
jgi:DNA (cytosine-5)-methyltransferase 1